MPTISCLNVTSSLNRDGKFKIKESLKFAHKTGEESKQLAISNKKELDKLKDIPAVTTDKRNIKIYGNLDLEDEMEMMNSMSNSESVKWILKENQTGKANMDIDLDSNT